MADPVKSFYAKHHDQIANKRFNSPFWLRRYAHRQIHAQFLPYLSPGQHVLDVGCGEGELSFLMAQQGVRVTGIELSAPNVQAARQLASERQMNVEFLQGDLERLPFDDDSFDVVVSSHVLEHLPDLDQGLAEIRRVTKSRALIAMPTCLNPAAWVLLGGDNYWQVSKRSLWALPIGFSRTLAAFVRGEEGPNEGYGGNKDVPHVWRFPWKMRKRIERTGFRIERCEAGPLIVPYVAEYIKPLQRAQPIVDEWRARPVMKNLGYGSMVVCRKM
jgi:SAM-dependent methyltransferase